MNPLIVLLGILLLTPLTSWGVNEAMKVDQYPNSVSITEGASAHMWCCFETNKSLQQIRVTWNINNSENYLINVCYSNKTETSQKNSKEFNISYYGKCFNLTIFHVSRNNAGLYTCKVNLEIPILLFGKGNGTRLIVQTKHTKTGASTQVSLPATISVVATVIVATFCLACFLYQWRRRRLMIFDPDRPGRRGMIIREYPHGGEREPLEEMIVQVADRNSNSSQGSSQWCPVQVYESCDYFAVQNSEES